MLAWGGREGGREEGEDGKLDSVWLKLRELVHRVAAWGAGREERGREEEREIHKDSDRR